MTRTIKSFSDNKHYFLTIDETGHAVDCTCGDRRFRHRACKHMKSYNAAYEQATAFAQLVAHFDCRSQAVIEEKRAAYWNFELVIAC